MANIHIYQLFNKFTMANLQTLLPTQPFAHFFPFGKEM